jgi:hypothetical protein
MVCRIEEALGVLFFSVTNVVASIRLVADMDLPDARSSHRWPPYPSKSRGNSDCPTPVFWPAKTVDTPEGFSVERCPNEAPLPDPSLLAAKTVGTPEIFSVEQCPNGQPHRDSYSWYTLGLLISKKRNKLTRLCGVVVSCLIVALLLSRQMVQTARSARKLNVPHDAGG